MMQIVTVYLKGPYARGDKDWDRGVIYGELRLGAGIRIADNEYGNNVRYYPEDNIARVENTGHW